MTEEKKIKIGKICNKIATALFILFFIDTCVVITLDVKVYIVTTVIIAILFSITCIVGHKCLKDYKEQ